MNGVARWDEQRKSKSTLESQKWKSRILQLVRKTACYHIFHPLKNPTKHFIVLFRISVKYCGRQRRKELIMLGRDLRGVNQSRLHTRGDIRIVFLKYKIPRCIRRKRAF